MVPKNDPNAKPINNIEASDLPIKIITKYLQKKFTSVFNKVEKIAKFIFNFFIIIL